MILTRKTQLFNFDVFFEKGPHVNVVEKKYFKELKGVL